MNRARSALLGRRGLLTAATLWALALSPGCDDDSEDPPVARADGAVVDAGADQGETRPDAHLEPGPLEVSPTEIRFGEAPVGEPLEASLVLRNAGAAPLQITAFEGLAPPFSASRVPPLAIPAGAERTLVLTVQAEVAGPLEQTLRLIHDGAAPGVIEVVLSAEGVTPEARLETPIIDFGSANPGDPRGEFITLRNESPTASLRVNDISGLAAPFEVPAGQLPVQAAPGEEARILVQFTPEAEGSFEQTATVRSNAGSFEVSVRGRVVLSGDLAVRAVQPPWGPVAEARRIIVHGGPFEAAPTALTVGGVALIELERIDTERVAGTLPAESALAPGLHDVRVDVGGRFGVGAGRFARTPPAAEGRALDAAALAAGSLDPSGNPWRLAIDTLPAETELVLEPGTVILAPPGAALTVAGTLRSGEGGGVVVFAPAEEAPWAGLRFADATPASALTDLAILGAGADGAPCVTSAGQASFTRLQITDCGGDGLRVEAGGTLIVLGAVLSDLAGDGLHLPAADARVFRLQDTWIRDAGWPLRALPVHFGGRAIGGGHRWRDNAVDAIGLGGPITTDFTLSGQPEGISYRLWGPIDIAAGATLTLAAAAPLRLDDTLTVAGTLALVPGGTLNALPGGAVRILDGGTLSARATREAPISLQARPDAAPNPGGWHGVTLEPGGRLDVENASFRDGGQGGEGASLQLLGDFEPLRGCAFEASADVGLHLAARGDVLNASFGDNLIASARITAGAGRLTGITRDAADPALIVDPVALCADWARPAFRRPDMSDAPTSCPVE